MHESLTGPLPHSEINIDEQLSLRQVRVDEAGTIFNLIDSERPYMGKFLPWVELTKTVQDTEEFIEQTINERRNGSAYGYGIVYDGNLVGHMSLMHLNDGEKPEIGCWISSKMSGHGISTKAAGSLTSFAFDELKLDKVLIKAEPENIGSNKIAEKLGYKLTSQERTDDNRTLNVWEIEQN